MKTPEAKLEALELLDEVLEQVSAADGRGVSIWNCARALDLEYNWFYYRAMWLAYMGKIKIVRGRNYRLRIVGPYDDPPWEVGELTFWQRKVIDFLSERADERGFVAIGQAQINRGIGHTSTCFGTILCLDKSGFLEIVERGNARRPALYRVYPNGDGPARYSDCYLARPPFRVQSRSN